MQLSGIAVILFLIYKTYSNSEKKKVSEERYSKPLSFNFIQFLGNADLVLGLLLLIDISFGFIPHFLLFFFALILLGKGLIFVWSLDIASVIDIMSSIIIISSSVVMFPEIILIVISIYLIQKGAFSLFN